MAKQVYVAFSGGGAKAVIHTGALKYIESTHKIVGVSGTSAGAIIAALKAAGYKADEIFNPAKSGESKILNSIKRRRKDITFLGDLLSGGGIKDLSLASNNFKYFALKKMGFAKIILYFILFLSLSFIINYCLSIFIINLLGLAISLLIFSLIFIILAGLFLINYIIPLFLKSVDGVVEKGISCSSLAVEEICTEVAKKLKIFGRPVLLGDFPIPIFIVATDITNKRAVTFSKTATPTVALKDALSASICIPGAFRVHEMQGVQYIDGGIVSNLPAFVFSEELELHPQRRVVALRIVEEDIAPKKAKNPFSCLLPNYSKNFARCLKVGSDIVQTVFMGTQELAHAKMRIVQATLPTPLRVLDFNLTLDDAKKAHEQGRVAAEKLILEAFTAEDRYNSACEAIANFTKAELLRLDIAKRKSGEIVRVAMAFRSSDTSPLLSIPYGYGFANKPDWQMAIPVAGSVCGEAWIKQDVMMNLDPKKLRSNLSNFPHIKSRLDPNMQWVLSVPILNPNTGRTEFVINIDSNSKVSHALMSGRDEQDELNKAFVAIVKTTMSIGYATLNSISEFRVDHLKVEL